MIGSHNSWTYAKPQWWARPFAWMARCQNKTIREQYDTGIRFFDLHVRWIYDKGMMPVHGMTVYKAKLDSDLDFLDRMGDCKVRVLIDLRTQKKGIYDYQKERFVAWMEARRKCFKNITFLTCRTMPEWKKLVEVEDDDCVEYHASKAKNRLWCLCPWFYAKTHRDYPDTEKPILTDFVDMF